MDNINQSDKSIQHEKSEAQRDFIKLVLDEIAIEVEAALRDAGMNCPVYLTVPTSGDAIAGIMTPTDPLEEDWSHISAVVCQIIGKRLGGSRLSGRELRCATVNAAMVAADLIAE